MARHIRACVHIIRSHYHGIGEDEIMWRSWRWVEDTIKRIVDDKREERRWQLRCALVSGAAYSNPDDKTYQQWKELYESLFTHEELVEIENAREEAADRRVRERNANIVEAMRQQHEATGQRTVFVLRAGGRIQPV